MKLTRLRVPCFALSLFFLTIPVHAQDRGSDPNVGRTDGPVDWVVLTPKSTEAQSEGPFTVGADQSIFFEGPAEKDVHTFEFETEMKSITALRLEILTDDRLPKKGPGWADNGNFVLNQVTLEATSKFSDRYKPFPVKLALADHSQNEWPISGAVDASPATGWAILPHAGKPHVALIRLFKPMVFRTGARFRIALDYGYGSRHVLGKIRVSATDFEGNLPLPGIDDRWAEVQASINAAIDRGVQYLIGKQGMDGSWGYHRGPYPTGQTGLSVYTLLKSGVPKNQPVIRRGREFLVANTPIKTYSMACSLLALMALDDPGLKELIQERIDHLLSWQRGGFAYPSGGVDLSCTQYGALALYVAAKKGFIVPEQAWDELADQTLKHQRGKAQTYSANGYSYRPGGDPTGSMTAAGLGVLAIADTYFERKRSDVSFSMKSGLEWMARYFIPSANPVEGKKPDTHWVYYYLYGLERVGGILGIDRFGPYDWYRMGAKYIIDSQNKEGSWSVRGGEHQPQTCFALLFLSKATSPVSGGKAVASGGLEYGKDDPEADISMRATGDHPLTMWVSAFGEAAKEDFMWPRQEAEGLRVVDVEYLASRHKDMREAETLDIVDGQPDRPSGWERFAIQHRFPRPGTYFVQARMTIVPPHDKDEPAEHELLESEPLEVKIVQVIDDELLRYAGDRGRNLMIGNRVKIEATSQINNHWSAGRTTDGFLGNGWMSQDDDPLPSISYSLNPAIRVTDIVLSPTLPNDKKRDNRIKKVELIINGRKTMRYEIDMVLDDWRKTYFTLPKSVKVRKFELRVLEVEGTHPKKRGVGFAEVELQYNRKLKKDRG